jgi:hypothetical protein
MVWLKTQHMYVHVPLCATHRRHWLAHEVLVPLGLVAVFVLPSAVLYVLCEIYGAKNLSDMVVIPVGMGLPVGLVVWIVTALVVRARTIRVVVITDSSITLTGISEGFVTAFQRGQTVTEMLPIEKGDQADQE